MDLKEQIPDDWKMVINEEFAKSYFPTLSSFVSDEMKNYQVFPPRDEIFSAFKLTSYDSIKVLILGQDPYHDQGQAHGLCFSVRKGVKIPPSLRNIYKELRNDLGLPIPLHGFLENWAKQGILMLNTSLTVRAHLPGSHAKSGWEYFTDAVIEAVNRKTSPVVFVLWGASAMKKAPLIDESKHHIVSSAHPSPLSASRGFFGSRPFSKINSFLGQGGHDAIDWCPAQEVNDLFSF
ncbi:MAG: uracil-DNA glycosylase [Lentisphaerae bacterium GWF2_45_14]|nr:MAG: uracil-DNA glycosylase [Lentisphaerae bacterium GWF2_45_14]